MELVNVVEFLRPGGNYATGDQAGFAPELADTYVERGFAKLIARGVPKVDVGIVAHDAARRLEEIRAQIVAAGRTARAAQAAGAPGADDALGMVEGVKASLAALERQIAASGPLPAGEPRRPNAAARAV